MKPFGYTKFIWRKYFIPVLLSMLSGYYEGLGGKMEINFIVAIFAISL